MNGQTTFLNGSGYFIEFTYLIASILFILGLKAMSHPDTARKGMFLAEAGMLAAIIGTLFHKDIVSYQWILGGLVLGSIVGALMAIWVPMTAMPERTIPPICARSPITACASTQTPAATICI